ncbi:hypothetical protein ID866_12940 [Astraeus odoratus]|nr:hypothetical protein ID866_12940 [Astraeus odoratus]
MPLSFPPSTPRPRNPGSPSDDDPGNDDDENPFNNNNSNDNDDDDDNDDYEDTDNGTQEDWAIQVFESLTHAIDSLACASRKSSSSSSQIKVHEPDTFDGTDPKKLCTFLVQWMALEWFKPDLLSSGNPRSCPLWMDDWTEFVIKLQSTFGPHNPVADAKNQLDHLQMKESYGDGALHHQFYSGLPDHIKDKICHIAQEIDTCYWECKEEVQRANKSSSTNNFPINKPGSSVISMPNPGSYPGQTQFLHPCHILVNYLLQSRYPGLPCVVPSLFVHIPFLLLLLYLCYAMFHPCFHLDHRCILTAYPFYFLTHYISTYKSLLHLHFSW